jgi:hypothetical protein
MNGGELMTLLIVAMVMIAGIVKSRYRADSKFGPATRDDGAAQAENARLRDELRGMKERLAVLERLATDDTQSARLDREIEKLRDRN